MVGYVMAYVKHEMRMPQPARVEAFVCVCVCGSRVVDQM